MRQALINENADLVRREPPLRHAHHRQRHRRPGPARQLHRPGSRNIPVLVTTSRLLSTGVDAQTCRLIVLDRDVGSMTEFKQIVGRGTRVHEDTKKFYFTLIDFRGATSHFADPDFDGEPVQIYEPGEDDPIAPPDDVPPTGDDGETAADQARRRRNHRRSARPTSTCRRTAANATKVYVDGVGATIIAERVEYLDENGKLVTESLRDFTKKALKKRFASLDDFLKRWKAAERKQAIIEELEAEGLPLDPIAEEARQGPRPLRSDLPRRLRPEAAHPPRARRERQEARRVHQIRRRRPAPCSMRCSPNMPDEGVLDLDDTNVLKIAPFNAHGHADRNSSRHSAAGRASSRPSTNCNPPSIRRAA